MHIAQLLSSRYTRDLHLDRGKKQKQNNRKQELRGHLPCKFPLLYDFHFINIKHDIIQYMHDWNISLKWMLLHILLHIKVNPHIKMIYVTWYFCHLSMDPGQMQTKRRVKATAAAYAVILAVLQWKLMSCSHGQKLGQLTDLSSDWLFMQPIRSQL